MLIGWNSINFDQAWLNARALKWGLPEISDKFHLDLYRVFARKFKSHKFQSCSLSQVCRFLRIKGEHGEEKGHVDADTWLNAIMGDKKSLQNVIDHCVADVQVLPPIFDRIKGKIRSISKA